MPNKYDIFISYRRLDEHGNISGRDQARLIAKQLELEGYHPFFDYSEIKDNEFDKVILPAIENCKVFILVLTKDSLNRCKNEEDWVRKEIETALGVGCKIINVTPDNSFNGWPTVLPESLSAIRTIQISDIHMGSLFETSVKKLIEERIREYLKKKEKEGKTKWQRLRPLLVFGLFISFLFCILCFIFCRIELSDDQEKFISMLNEDMVYVEGGSFIMGESAVNDTCLYEDEFPVHKVTVEGFYISKFEVTQNLWVAIVGENHSYWKGDSLPMINVSYNNCKMFIDKLNALTGGEYRLPTEAEWEYAAKGGLHSERLLYSGSNDVDSVAWYYDNSSEKIHKVGMKRPNALGIYDMSGNVWEWCEDWYSRYNINFQNNPQGPKDGEGRVTRGGSWYNPPKCQRNTNRDVLKEYDSNVSQGFRLVSTKKPKRNLLHIK